MVTDRVGDFIIRLQNAAMIGKREVQVDYSSFLLAIAKKLKELGFLSSVTTSAVEGKVHKSVLVELAYNERGDARLKGVHRISKPGRRLYTPHTSAHKVKAGTGALIISTPAGVLSDSEARKGHVGGEELFEIW